MPANQTAGELYQITKGMLAFIKHKHSICHDDTALTLNINELASHELLAI